MLASIGIDGSVGPVYLLLLRQELATVEALGEQSIGSFLTSPFLKALYDLVSRSVSWTRKLTSAVQIYLSERHVNGEALTSSSSLTFVRENFKINVCIKRRSPVRKSLTSTDSTSCVHDSTEVRDTGEMSVR